MIHRAAVPVVLAATLIASACGSTAVSGAEGTVTAGPMCPGPVRVDQPCPDRPVQVWLTAVRFPPNFRGVPLPQSGRVEARFMSDAAGRFRVNLRPGDYLVYGDPRQTGFVGGCRGMVSVPPRQWAQVQVSCDTGMR